MSIEAATAVSASRSARPASGTRWEAFADTGVEVGTRLDVADIGTLSITSETDCLHRL